jgi:hypothetical protein
MKHKWISGWLGRIPLFTAVVALALTAVPLAGWDAAAAHDAASRDAFVGGHTTKTAPPFSFVYGGKALAGMIGKWAVTSNELTLPSKTIKTVVYSDPATKLRVTVVYTIFKDYPAVEWVLRLKNEGAADTPILEDVQACAVRFDDWPQ